MLGSRPTTTELSYACAVPFDAVSTDCVVGSAFHGRLLTGRMCGRSKAPFPTTLSSDRTSQPSELDGHFTLQRGAQRQRLEGHLTATSRCSLLDACNAQCPL